MITPHEERSAERLSVEEKKPLVQRVDVDELEKKVLLLSPEQIKEKLAHINRKVQMVSEGHEVQVVADPSVQTWATSRIPQKVVLRDGTVRTTHRFRYIVAMPYPHLAIDDQDFIAGEVRHELGHVRYTDWRMMKELSEWVEKQGYEAKQVTSLMNCLEDPRMEHVSVLPFHLEGHVRKWFWAKNKDLILPNIGDGIEEQHPVNQFDFLIKLTSLWQLHAKNAEDEEVLAWEGLSKLHPKVQEIWGRIRSSVEQIVGKDGQPPEMIASRIKKVLKEVLWPEKKALIDSFGTPPSPSPDVEPGHGDGERDGCEHFHDPDDVENLPPEVQKLIQQKVEQYGKEIEAKAQQQIEQNKKADQENKKIEKEQQKRLERKDGISTPETRRKYQQLRRESKVIQLSMKRMFEKYFPKIAYPREIFGVRGKSYDAREHLKRYGTGLEKPMGIPNIPEKAGFVLQIIVDVSGSMYQGRIDEVIKTVIGILEAAEDYPINIEVLASDDKHGGMDERYILKAFDDEFSGTSGGRVKERLVGALTQFGNGNNDVDSLQWAIPRIEAEKKALQNDYEKLAVLTIFLSDAQQQGQQDPEVVNALRKRVPILGGCIEPDPAIKQAVEKAYGPIGEGSFCPSSLAQFPGELEKVLRKKIRGLFRT